MHAGVVGGIITEGAHVEPVRLMELASIDLNCYAEHILIRSCHLNVNVQDDGV